MKEIKTVYKCDRCGNEINSIFFCEHPYLSRRIMSATQYEIEKYGYLQGDAIPLPDSGVVVLNGVYGYKRKKETDILLCSKCAKKFKKFMEKGE